MKNIIYIHSHDTGRYIEPYGHPVKTPHLMQMAKSGTLFRHAYCAAPNCSPSRAALLTGMMPHQNGMVGLAHNGTPIKDYSRHMSHYLAECGYETVLCGIQHEAAFDKREKLLGYTKYLTDPCEGKRTNYEKDRVHAQTAVDFIKNSSNSDQPFFLNVGFHNPHRPFPEEHKDINADYVMPMAVLYDHPQNREDTAQYMAAAQQMDECVGRVLQSIKESGLEENSIIMFTTDHGPAVPHMKSTLYDAGIGVSLIMQYPGNPTKGKVLDGLVSQIDVFPTLCELADITRPDWLEGVSLTPMLSGQKEKVRDEVFAELNYHSSYEPVRGVRTERYKYIRRWEKDMETVVPNHMDKGESKQFMIDHGWLEHIPEEEELYDLYFDPLEGKNLVSQTEYAEIRTELSTRLNNWMKETDDPLLKGRVPTPGGYRLFEDVLRERGEG